MALFLLPMLESLPGGEVGVSASFHMIFFSFEAVRGKYLSRTQRLRKGQQSCPFCTQHKLAPGPKQMYDILYTSIYIYMWICTLDIMQH